MTSTYQHNIRCRHCNTRRRPIIAWYCSNCSKPAPAPYISPDEPKSLCPNCFKSARFDRVWLCPICAQPRYTFRKRSLDQAEEPATI